jgi:hypothetical protein
MTNVFSINLDLQDGATMLLRIGDDHAEDHTLPLPADDLPTADEISYAIMQSLGNLPYRIRAMRLVKNEAHKCRVIVREVPEVEANLLQRGRWNGYVAVPKNHPWYGSQYYQIGAQVGYSGLTYSEQEGDEWVVGFDTAMPWAKDATEQDVAREADRLLTQAIEACDPYSRYYNPNTKY